MRTARCANIREFPSAGDRSPYNKEKSIQDRARGSEVEPVGVKEHFGERDRRRGSLILPDAEEADSINSRARERNNVVLGRDDFRGVLSGTPGTVLFDGRSCAPEDPRHWFSAGLRIRGLVRAVKRSCKRPVVYWYRCVVYPSYGPIANIFPVNLRGI